MLYYEERSGFISQARLGLYFKVGEINTFPCSKAKGRWGRARTKEYGEALGQDPCMERIQDFELETVDLRNKSV